METVKIKWAEQKSTGQIYSNGVEMALCSVKNEQIGPFVFCKDFFQDAIKGFINNTKSSIYGYSYDPATMPPIDLKNVRILLRNTGDSSFLKKAPSVLNLLNQVEKEMKTPLTTMRECVDPTSKSGTVLLVGDGSWLRSPASLSMYTLLARNGLVHTVGNPFMDTIDSIISGKKSGGQRNDGLYLKFGKPGIELILKKGIDEVFGTKLAANYQNSVPTHIIHHMGGLVAFSSKQSATVKQWPSWLFPEKQLDAPGVCFS